MDDRVGPSPSGLDLVAAHEQGLVAADHIHDQAFIGVRHVFGICPQSIGKSHVQRHLHQAHTAGTRFFDHDHQVHALIRLQANDQDIGLPAIGIIKDRMGWFFERDGDFGVARAQFLAGAQVKGRALPTPIGDFNLERDVAFGFGIGVFGMFDIATITFASQILAAHDFCSRYGLQGTDHLDLFVAHSVGVKVVGRLHRDQA